MKLRKYHFQRLSNFVRVFTCSPYFRELLTHRTAEDGASVFKKHYKEGVKNKDIAGKLSFCGDMKSVFDANNS